MLNLTFSPYCAEFEMVTIANGVETHWPRRPLGELLSSIEQIRVTGLFVVAIALYNNHDTCLFEYWRWLERKWALGHNLVMKKRPSRQYKKLWDAVLIPCSGPVVVDNSGRWTVNRASISQAGSLA